MKQRSPPQTQLGSSHEPRISLGSAAIQFKASCDVLKLVALQRGDWLSFALAVAPNPPFRRRKSYGDDQHNRDCPVAQSAKRSIIGA